MKNFNLKSFVSGIIIGTIGITTVFATVGIKSATFNTNKVIFDGVELNLHGGQMISVVRDGEKDASNYMPVRTVLESMGYSVDWDSIKNAVIINDKKNESKQNDNILQTKKTISYNLVPMYVIGSKKYNGDSSQGIHLQDSEVYLSFALCRDLIGVSLNDYEIDSDKAKFSDGELVVNTDKYFKMESVQKNARDSYQVLTIQNGSKRIVFDESKKDNYPVIIQGKLCLSISELKSKLGIEFDYVIDDTNGTITFSNITSR